MLLSGWVFVCFFLQMEEMKLTTAHFPGPLLYWVSGRACVRTRGGWPWQSPMNEQQAMKPLWETENKVLAEQSLLPEPAGDGLTSSLLFTYLLQNWKAVTANVPHAKAVWKIDLSVWWKTRILPWTPWKLTPWGCMELQRSQQDAHPCKTLRADCSWPFGGPSPVQVQPTIQISRNDLPCSFA